MGPVEEYRVLQTEAMTLSDHLRVAATFHVP
jgi:hypothetical protein